MHSPHPRQSGAASRVKWEWRQINLSQTIPKLSCSSLKHSTISAARGNLFSHVMDSSSVLNKGDRLHFPQCGELNKYSLTVNAEVTFFNGLKKKSHSESPSLFQHPHSERGFCLSLSGSCHFNGASSGAWFDDVKQAWKNLGIFFLI